MRFYVYRHGYNGANNPIMSGGPEDVQVAEVEANDADEARKLAEEAGVTCYNNQYLYARDADKSDAQQAAVKRRVKLR